MSVLEQYEPKEPLRYFEKLCSIPHGSRNTKKISDYCMEFAKERGLEAFQDKMNNVIIIKEATEGYENTDPIIIQGHLDMVCEKTQESTVDFEKDGLELETDGKYLWAKGTTLGGDDGIAVAYALAILDSKDIVHPRIEAVFTVDEEIGLLGAQGVDLSPLKGKRLLNIDSEQEGTVLTSCAGGLTLESSIPLEREEQSGVEYEIVLTGMVGGHSGAEIDKGQGNSNVLMGRILHMVSTQMQVGVLSAEGGSKDNAIPRHTAATVLVADEDSTKLEEYLSDLSDELQKEYTPADAGMHIEFRKVGEATKLVLTEHSAQVVYNALMNLPNGIQTMSKDIPGLVETSLNMGVMRLKEETLEMTQSIRSSKESAKKYLTQRCKAMIDLLGGTSVEQGNYPGWAYKADSKLRELFVKVYTEQYGEPPKVEAIHAGLECGLFSDKIEDLDCISIGPNIYDIHTYEERLDLESTKRTWDVILGILAEK